MVSQHIETVLLNYLRLAPHAVTERYPDGPPLGLEKASAGPRMKAPPG